MSLLYLDSNARYIRETNLHAKSQSLSKYYVLSLVNQGSEICSFRLCLAGPQKAVVLFVCLFSGLCMGVLD